LYIDGESFTSSFQPADFTPITSSFYLNEDGGVENPIDIELTGVTNHSTARRLAKLNLLDTRQELVVQCTTKVIGLQLVAGDNLTLSLDRYGFVNKLFEVVQLEIQPDLTVNLTLRETSSEIYDFPVGEDVDRDLSPNTNLPSPFIVPAPSNFSATEVTTIDADGTVFPAVELNWSSNLTGSISDIEITYALTSSNDYQVLGKFGRDTVSFTTLDVAAGDTYNFRAQNFNYLGVFSSYVSASLKVLGDTIRPQAPIGGSMTGGTGTLQINWTNSAVDTDYRFTQVFIGTSAASASAVDQGRVSGTTFNKTITESGTYYGFLKNIDTSGNESDVSSGGNAVVSAIGSGSAGPPGPSGSAGFAYVNIHQLANTVPATPIGNLPVGGWTVSVPANDGRA
jgi:hypothetical protein